MTGIFKMIAWLITFMMLVGELQLFAHGMKTCSVHTDCDTMYCNPNRRTCDCRPYRDPTKRGREEKHLYDDELDLCLSRVNQLCTTVSDDLFEFKCIPYAICDPHFVPQQKQSKQRFGYCRCEHGYTKSDDNTRCISNVQLGLGGSSRERVPSMDLVKSSGLNRNSGSTFKNRVAAETGIFVLTSALCVLACLFPFR